MCADAAGKVIRLGDGEFAVFGYGSLFSIESLERTLGRRYTGPFVVCRLEGWRRGWDAVVPNRQDLFLERPAGRVYPRNILYLNVRRAPDSRLNGVLFVLNAQELEAFDRREWVYDREDITEELSGAVVAGSRAFVYVAKPEYCLKEAGSVEEAAVRATYLGILEAGFRDLGQGFRAEYDATTDPVPQNLLIADRRE